MTDDLLHIKEIFMKKLLIATAVGALVLTGCTTTQTASKGDIQAPKGDMHGKHTHKHGEKHGKKGKHPHGEMTEEYTCDNDAKVVAKYNPDAEKAILNITAPTLSLNGAEVEAKHVPSGSGMLFVNDVNPASKYEWHAKGSFGMLDVTTADGKTYSLKCEGKRQMHDHHHHAH